MWTQMASSRQRIYRSAHFGRAGRKTCSSICRDKFISAVAVVIIGSCTPVVSGLRRVVLRMASLALCVGFLRGNSAPANATPKALLLISHIGRLRGCSLPICAKALARLSLIAGVEHV